VNAIQLTVSVGLHMFKHLCGNVFDKL